MGARPRGEGAQCAQVALSDAPTGRVAGAVGHDQFHVGPGDRLGGLDVETQVGAEPDEIDLAAQRGRHVPGLLPARPEADHPVAGGQQCRVHEVEGLLGALGDEDRLGPSAVQSGHRLAQ